MSQDHQDSIETLAWNASDASRQAYSIWSTETVLHMSLPELQCWYACQPRRPRGVRLMPPVRQSKTVSALQTEDPMNDLKSALQGARPQSASANSSYGSERACSLQSRWWRSRRRECRLPWLETRVRTSTDKSLELTPWEAPQSRCICIRRPLQRQHQQQQRTIREYGRQVYQAPMPASPWIVPIIDADSKSGAGNVYVAVRRDEWWSLLSCYIAFAPAEELR